jgi:hypothetical protein
MAVALEMGERVDRMVFETKRAQWSDIYGCIRFAVPAEEGAVALKCVQRSDESILS